jgi:hypothetical protein
MKISRVICPSVDPVYRSIIFPTNLIEAAEIVDCPSVSSKRARRRALRDGSAQALNDMRDRLRMLQGGW